jgi:hypothetical protein
VAQPVSASMTIRPPPGIKFRISKPFNSRGPA